MSPRTVPISLVAALIALASARSIALWDELPATMASHFGAGGAANGWQGKASFFVVYGLLGLGTALTMLLLPQRAPAGTLNIPHRDYWLAPDRIDEARRKLTGYMDWVAVAVTLLLVITLELVLRANVNRSGLDERIFLPCLVAFFVFTFGWLVVMWRGFRPPRGK